MHVEVRGHCWESDFLFPQWEKRLELRLSSLRNKQVYPLAILMTPCCLPAISTTAQGDDGDKWTGHKYLL